jgi:hypothetical protein
MKKFIKLIYYKIFPKKIYMNQLKEIEWANVYSDSIRGKENLESLSLNIGRWAGNYSFFYILNRILSDFKIKAILEFGLGESSKFISKSIENYNHDCKHIVIEHNSDWIEHFNSIFKLNTNSKIVKSILGEIKIKNHISYSYIDLDKIIDVNDRYDLYIIDGPFGSDRYSRFDIIKFINNFKVNDEFIILFDDVNRKGESDSVNEILKILRQKGIIIYTNIYIGNKSNMIIATEKYKFSTSL